MGLDTSCRIVTIKAAMAARSESVFIDKEGERESEREKRVLLVVSFLGFSL